MSPEILQAVPTIDKEIINHPLLTKEVRKNLKAARFTLYEVCRDSEGNDAYGTNPSFLDLIKDERKHPNKPTNYFVAIETISTPKIGNEYEKTVIDKALDLKSRRKISPNEVLERLGQERDKLLRELGFPEEQSSHSGVQIRFPDVFESYTLGQKERWIDGGDDEVIECTSVLYTPPQYISKIIIPDPIVVEESEEKKKKPKQYICIGCSKTRGNPENEYFYLTVAQGRYGYHNLGFRFLIKFPISP